MNIVSVIQELLKISEMDNTNKIVQNYDNKHKNPNVSVLKDDHHAFVQVICRVIPLTAERGSVFEIFVCT